MEHLALEIFNLDGKGGSQYAYLSEDTSITITDTSEVFASGDVWSHAFTLNVNANAKIFGTSGDIHGSRLHEQLNGRRARIWVDGLPLYLGYLKLDDEVDVDDDGNVDVTFEGGQKTFDELIEGGKANQVPMLSDVQIGMALWRKRWTCVEVQLSAEATYQGGSLSSSPRYFTKPETILTHDVHEIVLGDEDKQLTYFVSDGENDGTSVQLYPRMVFPKGSFYNMVTNQEESINCLNTDYPYDDAHPYCNIALCYQKYGYTVMTEENGVKFRHDDYSAEPIAQRGYEVMPANRVNSAPNFFVIYWLKALMKHIGIYIEENQMMNVEDLRRLFFVNTNCVYEEPKYLRNPNKYDGTYGTYEFGSKGPLISEYFGELVNEKYDEEIPRWNGVKSIAKPENCSLECKNFTEGKWYETVNTTTWENGKNVTKTTEKDVTDEVHSLLGTMTKFTVKPKSIAGMSKAMRAYYDGYGDNGYGSDRKLQKNLLLHRAIATSECFPNEEISTVIKALENGFGIRLLFDKSYKRVRIVLLRNIFRSDEIQNITGDILDEVKTENCIRGFKMTYGNTDNTEFYYKGFDDLLPHKKQLWIDTSDKHDYSRWELDAKYADLLNKVSAFDTTCYVTPENGNAFGIKVDKDAKKYDALHPSLFEYAGYMDAEDGDCTGEDETISTINVGFKPAIMNDTNYEYERTNASVRNQHFALFVGETMRPRRPDLKDLADGKAQPGVKSYNDSDAVYSTDKLYALHGNNGSDVKMVSGGVVTPGSFAVASDTSVALTIPSATINVTYITNPGAATGVHTSDIHKWHCTVTNIRIEGHINEGYRLYLQDNFEPNDDGICPVEKHDWGLTLGIMRGSGSDAYVDYFNDPNDGEGNDTWEVMPGSNATAHPDTCDSYGNLWDYNGSIKVESASGAEKQIRSLCPNTADALLDARVSFTDAERTDAGWVLGKNLHFRAQNTKKNGQTVATKFYFYWYTLVIKTATGYVHVYASPFAAEDTQSAMGKKIFTQAELKKYIVGLWNQYQNDMTSHDTYKLIYAVEPADWDTISSLTAIYLGYKSELDMDNGVGSTDGRVSLKLRAEKLNPNYVEGSKEAGKSNRYLTITNEALRGRGLMDQFYKEYSYWIRNARIVKLTERMTLAQFLTIDKTKRVRMGDYLGFIKKMQFSVSNTTGFGNVTVELMYI